jgi:hypothetical protein
MIAETLQNYDFCALLFDISTGLSTYIMDNLLLRPAPALAERAKSSAARLPRRKASRLRRRTHLHRPQSLVLSPYF